MKNRNTHEHPEGTIAYYLTVREMRLLEQGNVREADHIAVDASRVAERLRQPLHVFDHEGEICHFVFDAHGRPVEDESAADESAANDEAVIDLWDMGTGEFYLTNRGTHKGFMVSYSRAEQLNPAHLRDFCFRSHAADFDNLSGRPQIVHMKRGGGDELYRDEKTQGNVYRVASYENGEISHASTLRPKVRAYLGKDAKR